MARPVTITDDHLLATARAVFLEKGLHATTAEVAARAGVSEGILFKRYGSKVGLFRAAMNVGDEVCRMEEMLTDGVAGETAKERLTALAKHFVQIFRRIVPVATMSITQGAEPAELPSGMSGPNPAPLRAIRALSGFFAAEMEAGRMDVRDPEVFARILLGSIWHFVFMDMMLGPDFRQIPEDRFVRGLVDTLVEGVGADPARATPSPPRRRAVRRTRGARS
jgi:AcrR family transcriptional regulator